MSIQNSTSKNPDDIVITYAARTPLTKSFKGGLKDTPIDFLLVQLFKVGPLLKYRSYFKLTLLSTPSPAPTSTHRSSKTSAAATSMMLSPPTRRALPLSQPASLTRPRSPVPTVSAPRVSLPSSRSRTRSHAGPSKLASRLASN